jgi:hypothetical protein
MLGVVVVYLGLIATFNSAEYSDSPPPKCTYVL